MGIEYLDFDLELESGAGGYIARVLSSPTGEAEERFRLPFSADALENFVLKVGRARTGVRRIGSPQQEAAREFGSRLYEAVFTGEVRTCFRRSMDEADRQGRGLRVRLRLSEAADLGPVPWEYLYSEGLGRFLVLSSYTPLVRYIDLPDRVDPLAVAAPLRVLLVVSSPSDLPLLDDAREVANVTDALSELTTRGLVEITVLESATLTELRRMLRTERFHVFHFIGHGGFDERSDDGVLVFETEAGGRHLVSGHDLGTLLHDHRTLRLAVLNACEGARVSATDPFAGVAQSLVRQRIPAVVAMQFEITDAAAIVFSQELYMAVLDGYPVDAALAEARKAIFTGDNDIEWGTPVLYMRARDGRVFDFTTEDGRTPLEAARATAVEAGPVLKPVDEVEPVAEEQVVEQEPEPVAVAPTVDEPVLDEPVVIEPPEAVAPVVEEQVVEQEPEPVAVAPTVDEPVVDEPVVIEPPEPVAEEPVEAPELPDEVTAGPVEDAGPGERSLVDEQARPAPETRPEDAPPPLPRPEPAQPLGRWLAAAAAAVVVVVVIAVVMMSGGGEPSPTTASSVAQSTAATVTTTPTSTATTVAPVVDPGVDVGGDFVAVPGSAVIDGSVSEWPAGPAVESSAVVFGEQGGATARWRLMWDDTALYLLAVADDANLDQPWVDRPAQLWRGDSVHFELGRSTTEVQPSDGPRADDAHYLFGITPAGEVVAAVNPSNGSVFVGGDPDPLILVAGQVVEGGYVIEIAVPWEVIGVDPRSGLDLAMNLNVSDGDGSGNLRTMRSSNPARTTQNDPNIWEILVLG